MTLRLPDDWLWDFWFAVDGERVHAFFLHAPRSLGDPDLRHRNARIGHAVSRDLRTWDLLPDPFGPGEPGAFDDLATWTGSVLRHEGRWYMYYTGASTGDDGKIQRIGVATSDDLATWTRQDLVFEADARWYEKRADGAAEEAWRDPWVFVDEDTSTLRMLICARSQDGPPDGRGVIGYATADDPLSWKAGPPVSAPGEFGQLEVPQLVHLGGRWRILFCAGPGDHSAARLARPGVVREGGTHELVADALPGPYRLASGRFLVGDPAGRFYAGRLLEHQGQWHFFAWHQYDEHGRFVGELSDPMPVTVRACGGLEVVRPG